MATLVGYNRCSTIVQSHTTHVALASPLLCAQHANNTIDGDSQFEKWRTAVLGLSWAIFGAFVILFFVYLFKMLAPVCPCLNCCDDDDKNRVHP